MEAASSIITNISDKKSELSISLESTDPEAVEKTFTLTAWLVPRVSSYLFILLLVYWIITEQNGFEFSIPSIITPSTNIIANGYLGYHALGLSLWAVVCNQETIMQFAIPLCCSSSSYETRKCVHVLSQITGFLCGVGGMISILWYKNSSVSMPISGNEFVVMGNNYYIPYSPHAWLGFLFLGSWVIQCIGRCFPTYITLQRHRFIGRFNYVIGLGCCCLGLQQQQTRQLTSTLKLLQLANITNSTNFSVQTDWWFSQPSLGVFLLGLIGGATFLYGLL